MLRPVTEQTTPGTGTAGLHSRRFNPVRNRPQSLSGGRTPATDVATTVLAAREGHRLALNELLTAVVGSYVLGLPKRFVTHPTAERPMPPIARSCE